MVYVHFATFCLDDFIKIFLCGNSHTGLEQLDGQFNFSFIWCFFSAVTSIEFGAHVCVCTGMPDDEILRAEMVSQLCMNDRTHSSLLDLVSFQHNVYI